MEKEPKIFILALVISPIIFLIIKILIPLLYWLFNQEFMTKYLGFFVGIISYIAAFMIFNHINRCFESRNDENVNDK